MSFQFNANDFIGRRALIGYALGGTVLTAVYIINHKQEMRHGGYKNQVAVDDDTLKKQEEEKLQKLLARNPEMRNYFNSNDATKKS